MRDPQYLSALKGDVFVYKSLLAITFIAAIGSLTVGYLTTGLTLDEIDREWRIQSNSYLTYLWGLLTLVIYMLSLARLKTSRPYPWEFYYAYALSFTVAYQVAGHVSPVHVINAIFFAIIFNLARGKVSSIPSVYVGALAFWVVAPVLADYLGFTFPRPLTWFDGFRGFAFDRVEYAFVAGLAFVLIILCRGFGGYVRIPLMLLIMYCMWLAQTRFVYVAAAIALFTFWGPNKKFLLLAIMLAAVFLAGVFFGEREEQFVSGRADIYSGYLIYLKENLWLLVFGAARFYQSFNDGSVPHNFILQTILNWGLFGLLAWTLLIIKFWQMLGRKGKSILIYLYTYGLFHPGVDAFLIAPLTALAFVFATGLGGTNLVGTASEQNTKQ